MDHLKISKDKVKEATGKNWKQWFLILDTLPAKTLGHYQAAKTLREKYNVSSWWSQVITARYEKEHGYWVKHGNN